MTLMRSAPHRHAAVLPDHHYPNALFHLWHHPQLSTAPSPPSSRNRWRKAICLMFLWACEAADRFDAAGDSYLSAVSTPLLFSLCLCLLLPPSPPLKANLVAAFEQSLALMTARLQTLSVSSDQKVSRWYHDVNECCTISDMTKKQTIKEQFKGRNMWWWWW